MFWRRLTLRDRESKWDDAVLAESDRAILVEGNQYFPADDVRSDVLEKSESLTYCPSTR